MYAPNPVRNALRGVPQCVNVICPNPVGNALCGVPQCADACPLWLGGSTKPHTVFAPFPNRLFPIFHRSLRFPKTAAAPHPQPIAHIADRCPMQTPSFPEHFTVLLSLRFRFYLAVHRQLRPHSAIINLQCVSESFHRTHSGFCFLSVPPCANSLRPATCPTPPAVSPPPTPHFSAWQCPSFRYFLLHLLATMRKMCFANASGVSDCLISPLFLQRLPS